MSSNRRVTSSRANGARSRGPKTVEGKQRSSQNALRHGLLARCVVLPNESEEGFEVLLDQHEERLRASDGVELGLIEEMVAAAWRLRRTWAIETQTLENSLSAQPAGSEVQRITAAFSDPANAQQLNLVHRYETRLHMMFQRALHNLLLLRAAVPNEPSPNSGHLAPGPRLLEAPEVDGEENDGA